MLGILYNLADATIVAEENNVASIRGFPTTNFEACVETIWRTTQITKYLFRKRGRGDVEFDSFFIPDMVYVINKLIETPKLIVNRQALQRVLVGLKANTWYHSVDMDHGKTLDYSLLKDFKKSMLPHQLAFLDRYDDYTKRYNLNGYLLAAEPGTGKTLTSLALSECLKTDVTIIVAPSNSIDRVWATTLQTEFKTSRKFWTTSDSTRVPPLGCRYYVFHYEALGYALELAAKLKGQRVNIVLDECHNFNEVKSLRTERFIELCKLTKSKNVLWMSGTPIKAMGSETIPLLRTIDPLFNKVAEDRFKSIFGLSSTRGLDILAARLGYVSYKVEKSFINNKVLTYTVKVKIPNGLDYSLESIREKMQDFIKERTVFYKENMAKFIQDYKDGLLVYEQREISTIKEENEFRLYLNAANKLHTAYDPFNDKERVMFCNQYEKSKIIPALPPHMKEPFKEARSVYKYPTLKIQGEVLGRVLGKERMKCNLDLALSMHQATAQLQGSEDAPFQISLEEMIDNSVNKTLIFSDYTEVVNGVADQLRNRKYHPLRVLAETNKDLTAIIGRFEKDKNANPLLATYKSLSTAVPMIMADSVVFLNMPFRIHEYKQAIARLDRIGQPETIKAYQVFLDTGDVPNISTRSNDILAWSKDMVEAIMGTPTGDTEMALEMYEESVAELTAKAAVNKLFPSW